MADKPAPVASKSGTEVVDWKSQLNALTIATAAAEKPSSNWVSFKGGQLQINAQPMKDNKAKVVVIYSVFENQLYQDRYDPNNPQPPICYALSETDDDLKPHPDSAKPQAETCEKCPHNEWGSDPLGGRGKSCKNVRRLVLISENDLNAEAIPQAETAIAKLPVTSVKNWSAYASQIANVLKLPPLAVVSEMSVIPDAKTQFQVEFKLVDKVDEALIPLLLNKRKESHVLAFMPYDKPTEKQLNAAPQQPRKF